MFCRLKLEASARHAINPQLREDNRKAVTPFHPECQDEILQSSLPIAPKSLDEFLLITAYSDLCVENIGVVWQRNKKRSFKIFLQQLEVQNVKNSESYYNNKSLFQLLYPVGMDFHFTVISYYFVLKWGERSDGNILHFSSAGLSRI